MIYETLINVIFLIAITVILGSIGYPLLFEIFHSITRIHRYHSSNKKDRVHK